MVVCVQHESLVRLKAPLTLQGSPRAQVGLHRVGWAQHRWSCRGHALAACFAEIDKSTHLDLSCFPRWYREMSQSYCTSLGWQIRGSLCLAGARFRQQVSPAGRKHIAWLRGWSLFLLWQSWDQEMLFLQKNLLILKIKQPWPMLQGMSGIRKNGKTFFCS